MKSVREKIDYKTRLVRFIKSVEKMMIVCILAGFLLLMISQSLLSFTPIRNLLLETVKMEGIASK